MGIFSAFTAPLRDGTKVRDSSAIGQIHLKNSFFRLINSFDDLDNYFIICILTLQF
jgi:hypothetical protein